MVGNSGSPPKAIQDLLPFCAYLFIMATVKSLVGDAHFFEETVNVRFLIPSCSFVLLYWTIHMARDQILCSAYRGPGFSTISVVR